MDDIITNMRISLEKAHVKGIPEYIKNLQAISDSLEDFRLEGKAALRERFVFFLAIRYYPLHSQESYR